MLNSRSVSNLYGVTPKLVEVVTLARELSEVEFEITEGVRSIERQQQLVKEGKSRTLKSYHILGRAVDVVAYRDGKVTWDFEEYRKIAKAFKEAANQLNVRITWGGDWVTFRDGVHFQIEE